jgi:putative ABC transport system permease protein
MISLPWVLGLVRRRPAEIAGTVAAVALSVGFLAALGTFIGINRAHLTQRAAASVAVDWQVQGTTGSSPGALMSAARRLPQVRAAARVDLAEVPALSATSAGATHTTGRAFVVGIPRTYARVFPGEIRQLLGNLQGPALLQQTASNLGVGAGGVVSVHPTRGPQRTVHLAGVVDMPQADSFFQTVGAPSGAGPAAPPDDVLLVPRSMLASLVGGATVVHQIHLSFDHTTLPSDPAAAVGSDAQLRNHFEATLAGSGLVGDNLGAALSAAREDALYGELLFLLLGLPAFLVALTVTALVTSVRAERRVRELALLRVRGARGLDLCAVAGAEACAVLLPGIALGWPVAVAADRLTFGTAPVSWTWFGAGALCVAGLLAAVQLLSVRRVLAPGGDPMPGARGLDVPRTGRPWPLRYWLDVVLLVASGLVFWLVARGGYQVVVVPEGVPTTSVDWAALLAPALAWPGLAMLTWRLVDVVLAHARPLRSAGGRELVAAAVRRRRRTSARGATALAVAIGVAGSTAVFTATYREQSRLDVALTVGADVAVQLPSDPAAARRVSALTRQAPGVHNVSPQSHRFAYVGTDLQDLYGIDPATIAAATPLRDAFVPGGTVAGDMRALQRTPAGVLLSAETLHDYQLHPGDTLRLRLQAGPAKQYRAIAFTVVGQVAEWPTAPKDSFIVANSTYVARVTGQPGDTTLLINSSSPAATAQWLSARAGPAAPVADITSARGSVTSASGLAATDLGGLARLELGFGFVLAVATFGLALLVGVLQRRRALVILAALGATARQRGQFLAAEARVILIAGLVGGAAITAGVAAMLVKVMTGIFDPPPDHPSIPWSYFGLLLACVVVTALTVVSAVGRWAGRAGPRELRDL